VRTASRASCLTHASGPSLLGNQLGIP
jgi:hypothetical protein